MALEREVLRNLQRDADMRHTTRVRGLTLVELLVGLFVSSILLTILVKLFTVSFRVGQEELSRSATESSLVIMLNKLEKDLLSTSPAGLSLDPLGIRLVAHPILTVTERRQVIHEERFWYWSYDAATEQLFQSEYLLPPSGSFEDNLAYRFTEDEVGALPLTGSGRTKFELSGITDFRVTNPSAVVAPNVGSPLQVVVEAKVKRATNRAKVRFERKIWLRSGAS